MFWRRFRSQTADLLQRRIQSRAGDKLHCGAVVFVQRFTKVLSTYPHLHVLVLDGGYTASQDGTLAFQEVQPPTSAELRALEDRVERRFTRWLKRHGFLDEDGIEAQDFAGWWTAAATEPSGVLAPSGARRASRWQVDARVRVGAGDTKGREQLCRYVARPPFAGPGTQTGARRSRRLVPAVSEAGPPNRVAGSRAIE